MFAAPDPPPPAATVSVTVPEVATTASDGLPARLRPGRIHVTVPALLTVPGERRRAWLEVNGARGAAVTLTQGVPRWLTASAVGRPGTALTVRVVAGGTVISVWRHVVAT